MSQLLQKCCLVGESVGGDPTHFMIEAALAELGLDWRFLSFQTAPDRLAVGLAGLDALGLAGVRLRGAFADKPPRLKARTERARRTGRLTHLTRHDGSLLGDDATGPALVEALVSVGDAAGKRVVVLGAGREAPSVADVLVELGAALVAVADPDPDRAAAVVLAAQRSSPANALAAETRPLVWDGDWLELPDAFDWVVSVASWPKKENRRVAATLAPELGPGHTLIDLSIGSTRSPVLVAAADAGAATLDGLPVLVAETALCVEAWTGHGVDRAVLRDAAEEFLGL